MDLTKKTLSIASVLYPSLNSSLEGISADIFFRGCKRHCPGCHNLELQMFTEPNYSIQQVIDAIRKHNIKIVTLMGGEPLDMPIDALLALMDAILAYCPDISINVYTGYELSQVDPRVKKYASVIKTGMYDETQLNRKPSFLASVNQKYFRKDGQGTFIQVYP